MTDAATSTGPRTATAAPPKRVSVLGATGSVGESTLDLLTRAPGAFDVVALTGHANVEALANAARRTRAEFAVIADETRYQDLKAALSGTSVRVGAGREALLEAGGQPADCVVAAISGAAGLEPSLAAVRNAGRVALANKECLVAAGDLFMREVRSSQTELLPVDSEHSAVFQSIGTECATGIDKITLTASGGPFREMPHEQLAAATPEQALKHPNWSMGAKISIDSATLMNKGLELIEAFHLFPVRVDQLDAIVHPQSIIHCLVEFQDGSVLAQLAAPDMRTPIAYALSWPARMATPVPRLDLVQLATLTFEAPDLARFPALRLAKEALAAGGAAPTVMNAANEEAVAAFLAREIGFLDITRTVERTLEAADAKWGTIDLGSLAAILDVDREARDLARDVMGIQP